MRTPAIIEGRVDSYAHLLEDKHVAHIVLLALYWAEGTKRKGELRFGNSDPLMIKAFMRLLRSSYDIFEPKLHCTVLQRADQDIDRLKTFWSSITGIPVSRFFTSRIDKRSIGKPTNKLDYMGVCVVSYYSAEITRELCDAPRILFEGH